MGENGVSDTAPRFAGAGFEQMIETLSTTFGAFDAHAPGRMTDFRWTAEFSFSGPLTLTTGIYHGPWDLHSSEGTPERLAIVMPHKGALNAKIGRSMVEGHPGSILIANNCDADRFFVRGDDHVSDVLFVDWAVIAQTASGLLERPLVGALDLEPCLDLSAPAGRLLASLARAMADGMRQNGPLSRSPVALAHMTQGFADLLLRSAPHRFSHLLEKSGAMIAPRHVHRAMEYMRENIAQPITIPMVAAAAGVSVRALENGFRAFRETSPALYLRTIRLRAAREELLDPLSVLPVRDICLKWGFFHFGRFSALYRATYGESPSETKRQRAVLARG